MADNIPVGKIRELYQGSKELTASNVPVVRNSAVHATAALRQLLLQVDPEFCEHMLDCE